MLFNGRLYARTENLGNARRLGRIDAQAAAASARREGFPGNTIIFLDQEQGGRMLPEQKAYIYAWVDGSVAGGFRAGIYCSGIPATDDGNVVTAEDIRQTCGSAGRSCTGRSMMPARRRRDVLFRNIRRVLRRVGCDLRKSGSLRSPRNARTWPRTAPTTVVTGIAIRREPRRRKGCTST